MYFNVRQTLASGVSAGASFTTDLVVGNFDMGSVQVVWSGVDANSGNFQLLGSVNGSNFNSLTTSPSTMTTASSAFLFNLTSLGYEYVRCVYQAVSNTTGLINIFANQKGRR